MMDSREHRPPVRRLAQFPVHGRVTPFRFVGSFRMNSETADTSSGATGRLGSEYDAICSAMIADVRFRT